MNNSLTIKYGLGQFRYFDQSIDDITYISIK